jgi:hypothetical protein
MWFPFLNWLVLTMVDQPFLEPNLMWFVCEDAASGSITIAADEMLQTAASAGARSSAVVSTVSGTVTAKCPSRAGWRTPIRQTNDGYA